MWRFLRLVLAFTVGFFLTAIIGIVLLTISLSGAFVALSAKQQKVSRSKAIPDSSWLYIPLDGELEEYVPQDIDFDFFFSFMNTLLGQPSKTVPTLDELRQALEQAAEDKRIRGIVLHCADLAAYPAQIEQIARWLKAFRAKSGKPVHAYGNFFTEKTYYLAACADSIFMYPGSGALLEWNGLVVENTFFRKAMERWGVRPILVRVGRYKSAAESFTEEGFSQANREQLSVLLEDIWRTWVDSIAAWRSIPAESLRAWPNQAIFFSAQEALERRLVDALLPWESWLARYTPDKVLEDNRALIAVKRLLDDKESKHKAPKIAILYAQGEIGPQAVLSADEFVPVIQTIARDSTIKAVVLRVNSPGGAVLDADRMARALMDLKAQKPFVVSMGGVAASGGYYISAYADSILAERTTITGSIGVIGLLLNCRELLEKHLDLRTDRVKVGGEHADFMNPFREPDPYEVNRLQREIDQIYREFLTVVKVGRRYPSLEAVDGIGQGRVWSGEDAQTIGLVDALGGLDRAIAVAAHKAGLKEYRIEAYPRKKSFYEEWLAKWEASLRWLQQLSLRAGTSPLAIEVYWPGPSIY